MYVPRGSICTTIMELGSGGLNSIIRLMDKILHDPKDPKLWELWYIPYYGSCRILSINRSSFYGPSGVYTVVFI